jgi:LysM domain
MAKATQESEQPGQAVQPDQPEHRERRILTPAVLASALFVAACATFAISFVAARGGLQLPIAGTPPPVAVASNQPTTLPTPEPLESPAASVASTAPPATEPSPEPTLEPTAPPPTPPATEAPFALPAIKPGDPLLKLDRCSDHPVCFIYVVRRNDTMSRILGRYDLDLEVVLALNPQIDDPSIIVVGHRMYLGRDRFARLDLCPNGERCLLYKVVSGDSLKEIADRYAITVEAIRDANPGMEIPIQPKDVLKLPYPG